MKVAFIVKDFPVVSEPFIVNQIADLISRGIEVDVFAFQRGDAKRAAERYHTYRMGERTHILAMPVNRIKRIFCAAWIFIKLAIFCPAALVRMTRLLFDSERQGEVASLKYFFWLGPFLGRRYDLVHCHYATFATKYLVIRELLGDVTPFVTTLYGYDVSRIIAQKGPAVYAKLHMTCSRYLAMSNNMRERAIAGGFPPDKIIVHPVSLDTSSYPFIPRQFPQNGVVEIAMIARPVPKKAIGDFLKALAIVKEMTPIRFHATMVGGDGGPEHQAVVAEAKELGIGSQVSFPGEISLEMAHAVLERSHIYVQSSKTAPDGNME